MIEVYKPKLEDLWFRKMLLEDRDTMSYNHSWSGTIDFSEDKWNDWYEWWIINNDGKRYYRYLKDNDKYVGEVSYRYSEEDGRYYMGIIIYAPYRNKGYGVSGLKLLCDIAKDNGIKYLYDDIAIDNKAIKLFLDNGFIEEYRTSEFIYLKKDLSKAELEIDKYKVAPVKRSKVRYKNNNLSGEDIDLLRDNRRKKEKVSICDTHEDGA